MREKGTVPLSVPLPLLACLAALCSLVALCLCVSSDLHGTDNGELVAIFARGGMAHPPGYPLYSFFSLFSPHIGTPAFSAALFSALCVLMACSLCFAFARDAGGDLSFSLTLAASVLSSIPVLFVGAQAEVFALHLVLVAAVVFCASRTDRSPRWSFFLALCFSLGASQHHTLVFLAPVVLVSLRSVRASVLGVVFGLTPLLMWLVVDPSSQWVFAPVASVSDLFDHLLRRMYGTFGLITAERRATLLCAAFITWLVLASPLILLLRRPRSRFDVALLLSLLLCGPAFGLMAAMDPVVAPASSILVRFAAMPVVLLALFVARAGASRRRLVVLAACACVLQSAAACFVVRRALDDRADLYARTLLTAAPMGSVVVTERDHVFFPLLALQLAEGLRPDVTIVSEPLLVYDWFRTRLPVSLRSPDVPALVTAAKVPVVFDVPSERTVQRVPLRVFGAFAIANSSASASLADHLRAILVRPLTPLPGTTGCTVADDLLDAIDRERALGGAVDSVLEGSIGNCSWR